MKHKYESYYAAYRAWYGNESCCTHKELDKIAKSGFENMAFLDVMTLYIGEPGPKTGSGKPKPCDSMDVGPDEYTRYGNTMVRVAPHCFVQRQYAR